MAQIRATTAKKQLPSSVARTVRKVVTKRKTVKKSILTGVTRGLRKPMSRELIFGRRSKPKVLVVIFHGLGDTAAGCSSWAKKLAKGLKDATVVVPQSPEPVYWHKSVPSDQVGYDWIHQKGLQDTSDRNANLHEVHRSLNKSMRQVNFWLDGLLARYGLANDRLILAGYSQGSVLASVLGASRQVLGVNVCGGVVWQQVYSAKLKRFVDEDRSIIGWPKWEKFMPSHSPTRFLLINGTKDPYVMRRPLLKMMKPYRCDWHWSEGLGHDFPARWNGKALAWMRRIAS